MSSSFATLILGRLAIGVRKYPKAFLLPQIALFGVSVFYTIENLEFHTDRNALVSTDKQYHRNFLDYKENFDSEDDMVTVVESEDSEKNRQFVERLGARLAAEPELFTGVFYKGDLKMLGPKALLFLEDASVIEAMGERILNARPVIEAFQHVNSLESFLKELNRQFRTASEETASDNTALVDALPALQRILEQANASLTRRGTPPSLGAETLFGANLAAEQQKYITFADGKIYLATARPLKPDLKHEAIRRLRELVAIVQAEVPGINVGITGETVLALDEMRQSQMDSIKASCVSLVLVMLIFSFCYQETGRPIKATVCLLIGLGYTMGYTTLLVGHLNILTIAFFPMLIGLAIDFGVHLITRYEEELRHGASEEKAIGKSLTHTGQGVFTGCLTAAGAFYAMAFTEFKGVKEMGLITGGGMLLTLIPMMTILPILLLRGRQNVLDHQILPPPNPRETIEQIWLQRPKRTVLLGLILCGLALKQIPKVHFDYNLLNMQTENLPAVQYEKKLIQEAEKSVIFALVIANSLEEAGALETAIRQLPSVASIDSMTRFLNTDQTQMLKIINRLKREVGNIQIAAPSQTPVNLDELSQTLTFFQSYLSLAAKAVEKDDPTNELIPQFRALKTAAGLLQRNMRELPPERAIDQLTAFEYAFFNDIRQTFSAIANQDTREPLTVEDLPEDLRKRFIGRSGQHLLQVYPKENAWERTHQETFIQELRGLTNQHKNPPVVTGTPVQLLEYTTLLKQSYEEAALYALGVIAIMVLIHFRSLVTVILALLPVGIGSLWLIGVMGFIGLPFNPANIMTLPLVVGIGVTNGIHILNRYREEQNPSLLSKSTGKGVLVSGLTTMAGFGSLTLAHHRGIESLGYVMTIGVFTCMVAGLTLLPCVLQLRSEKKASR
ncbi:MAG: Siderophore exporter MmpL4 [Verrucomicrobia subdivision 3 bacterium]|nr:Siderophore exporter MmpL4 [Limisphaerales bacterium]MCS1417675.1 Siderophore exporter MmpL4 [Limisphaerales bacterium]